MAFEHRFAQAQATEVVDLSWGLALLQREFPHSHHHNRIVVTSAAPAVNILAAADECRRSRNPSRWGFGVHVIHRAGVHVIHRLAGGGGAMVHLFGSLTS